MEVLVATSATQLRHTSQALRVVSRSSQDLLSLFFSRETCILEKAVSPDFPIRRKSGQFVLVATAPLSEKYPRLRLFRIQRPSRPRNFQRWLVVLQFSRLLVFRTRRRASVTSRKVHLLSHDVVSWPTPNLIVRLNLLVSFWHRHRCERAFSQDTREALDSSGIFKVFRLAHPNHFFRKSPENSPRDKPGLL